MKVSKILALLIVLGLGACFLEGSNFLEQVKIKTMYTLVDMTSDSEYGTFSSDGRVMIDVERNKYIFVSTLDNNNAIYKMSATEVKFTISGNEIIMAPGNKKFYLK